MTFQVGDVVEVVRSRRRPDLIGQVSVVTRVRHYSGLAADLTPYEGIVVHTVCGPESGWVAECLRKIQPPDWSAPLTTELERERSGV